LKFVQFSCQSSPTAAAQHLYLFTLVSACCRAFTAFCLGACAVPACRSATAVYYRFSFPPLTCHRGLRCRLPAATACRLPAVSGPAVLGSACLPAADSALVTFLLPPYVTVPFLPPAVLFWILHVWITARCVYLHCVTVLLPFCTPAVAAVLRLPPANLPLPAIFCLPASAALPACRHLTCVR